MTKLSHLTCIKFRKIAKIFEENSLMYKTKYIPEFYEVANNFVSSLTTEERHGIHLEMEKIEKKMATGKLSGMKINTMKGKISKQLQAIYYKKNIFKALKVFAKDVDYTVLRTHELMNGATGQLATFLIEKIRNILAGNRQNAKFLQTISTLAEHIVIPAFDRYAVAEMSTNSFTTNVTTYLRERLSLPEEWIKKEQQIMHDGNQTNEKRQETKVLLYSNYFILDAVKFDKHKLIYVE
jgi:hypothetical protein